MTDIVDIGLTQSMAKAKSLFIIATNDCSKNLSMQLILDEYKSQQAVEQRIEALLMVMKTCLMI